MVALSYNMADGEVMINHLLPVCWLIACDRNFVIIGITSFYLTCVLSLNTHTLPLPNMFIHLHMYVLYVIVVSWWTIYTANMRIVQYNILYVCNRNVLTNFLPCSHSIDPNNKTCLVTCAASLTCVTWLMYTQFFL